MRFGVFFVCMVLSLSVGVSSGQAKDKADPNCIDGKITGYGFPNKMKSVANMNSIIQWMAATKKKHGDEYAQWHSAKEGKVGCRRSGTDLYTCHAEAQPCKGGAGVKKGS